MKAQMYIATKNTKISVRNKSFYVENETQKRTISPKKIESLAIISNANINASAIKLAAKNDIPIYYYDYTGNLIAQLRSPDFLKHASLRNKQIRFMNSIHGKEWAKRQVILKTSLQIQTLKRLQSEKPASYKNILTYIDTIEAKKRTLINTDFHLSTYRNTIMGIEGGIARVYFKALNEVLPEQYQFTKRSRMPGMDYFNVTMNYLYGITYSHVGKAIHAAGLDSFTGALHTTPYKETLVYDCIEPIRPVIDRLLIAICMQKMLKAKHFVPANKGFILNKEGKKLILPLYSDYLHKRIKIENKVTTVVNHLYLWARKLKLEILNTITDVPDML